MMSSPPTTQDKPLYKNEQWSMEMIITEKLIWLGLGVTAVGLLAGIFYQTVSEAVDRHKYPLLGQFVDVGGFRL